MNPVTDMPLMWFIRFQLILFSFLLASCYRTIEKSYDSNGIPNENHAAQHEDFTVQGYLDTFSGRGLIMGYKVGDRFRLRQQMFLLFSNSGVVYLNGLEEYESPNIDKYLQNPGAFRYGGDNPYQVIKLIPAGTVIEIVKITKYDFSPYPYFVIRGESNWFRCATFRENVSIRDKNGKKIITKTYDKSLFFKL